MPFDMFAALEYLLSLDDSNTSTANGQQKNNDSQKKTMSSYIESPKFRTGGAWASGNNKEVDAQKRTTGCNSGRKGWTSTTTGDKRETGGSWEETGAQRRMTDCNGWTNKRTKY